jgi:hypothetical protein
VSRNGLRLGVLLGFLGVFLLCTGCTGSVCNCSAPRVFPVSKSDCLRSAIILVLCVLPSDRPHPLRRFAHDHSGFCPRLRRPCCDASLRHAINRWDWSRPLNCDALRRSWTVASSIGIRTGVMESACEAVIPRLARFAVRVGSLVVTESRTKSRTVCPSCCRFSAMSDFKSVSSFHTRKIGTLLPVSCVAAFLDFAAGAAFFFAISFFSQVRWFWSIVQYSSGNRIQVDSRVLLSLTASVMTQIFVPVVSR